MSVTDGLSRLTSFLQGLEALAQASRAIRQCSDGIAEGSNRLNEAAAQLHSHFASASQITSGINPRRFYSDLQQLQHLLQENLPSHGLSSPYLAGLTAELEEFATLYDKFLVAQTGRNAAPLLFSAWSLDIRLRDFQGSLSLIADQLESTSEASEASGTLSISLPTQLDFRNFVSRLIALESIYSELCQLLDISEAEQPLRIAKIESGSLWAKVFGHSKVLELMASFIQSSASFLYRTYTSEGKIGSVPGKLKSLDAILDFSVRLKEAGVNTEELNDHELKLLY